MDEEEPAWRAELKASIREFDAYYTKEWLQLLEPHIQAAEERGRREALRQAQCKRCKGSGIDPEHSHPAEGPSYYSMGEPEALEPCTACQYPESP